MFPQKADWLCGIQPFTCAKQIVKLPKKQNQLSEDMLWGANGAADIALNVRLATEK